MTQSTPETRPESAPLAQRAAQTADVRTPRTRHAQTRRDRFWTTPFGRQLPLPDLPGAESPPPLAQPSHADTPLFCATAAPEPRDVPPEPQDAAPNMPCAESPPPAVQPSHADTPLSCATAAPEPRDVPPQPQDAAPTPCAESPPPLAQPSHADTPLSCATAAPEPRDVPPEPQDAAPNTPCAESSPPHAQPSQTDTLLFCATAAPEPQDVPPEPQDAAPNTPCAESSPPRPQPPQPRCVEGLQERPAEALRSAAPRVAPAIAEHWPSPPAIGMLLFEETRWAAACAGFGFRSEGHGIPAGLPEAAVWIVESGADGLAKMRAREDLKGLRLHGRGWLGADVGEILNDWGVPEDSMLDRAAVLSIIAERTVWLAERAAARFAEAAGLPAPPPLADAPSLAVGLRRALGPSAPQAPSGAAAEIFAAAFQRGTRTVRRTDVPCCELRLRVPRLEHALDTLDQQVPADGPWRRARLRSHALTDTQFRALAVTGLPVLVSARAAPKPGLPRDACLAAWGADPDAAAPRSAYTLCEVAEMLVTHEFRDHRILIGPGWRRPPEADLLDALVESLGGHRLAHASWSAGLAAAAILDAAMGPAERGPWADNPLDGDPDRIPPACVWIAARERSRARDRLRAMGPAAETAFAGDRGGCLRLRAGAQPDSRADLASAAWRAGLHMQPRLAGGLRDLGHAPAAHPDSWGGGAAAAMIAALSQRGDAERLWALDQISCLGPNGRAAALHRLTASESREDPPWA